MGAAAGFLIVSITGALKSMGNLTMCERSTTPTGRNRSRSDERRPSRRLVAVTVSGLLGGMASNTSASNVALSASGATSRYIGYSAGALFVLSVSHRRSADCFR
jgi:hypothetical protein